MDQQFLAGDHVLALGIRFCQVEAQNTLFFVQQKGYVACDKTIRPARDNHPKIAFSDECDFVGVFRHIEMSGDIHCVVVEVLE